MHWQAAGMGLGTLLLSFAGAVPSGLRPSAPCTSCRSFCDMQCSFDGPDPSTRGMKQNVSMFRLTPLAVTGLAEKDSGDPAGDVYFALVSSVCALKWVHSSVGLSHSVSPQLSRSLVVFNTAQEEKINPMHCRIDPHYYKCGWLNGTGGGTDTAGNVFEMYTVEVDGGWGPCTRQPYRHESLFDCVRMPRTRTNRAMQQLPCHARMACCRCALQSIVIATGGLGV